MFQSLTDRLTSTFRALHGRGAITEADIEAACKDVRTALLEADVHFKVAKKFVARVKERTVGAELAGALEPAQIFLKAVHDELVEVMGGTAVPLARSGSPPTVFMMVGLQGSGKTTTAGKLARILKKDGGRVMLVACDLQRPAAIDQLETLSKQIDVGFHGDRVEKDPVVVAQAGLKAARQADVDTVIFDTAGRLHVDEELMAQLERVKGVVGPHEVLMVVDAMTGQDALRVAETFDKRLALTGVILTKLDGDTRGGAALSIREVTGKPIKFAGMGEKLDQLQVFHPERMATRILNMGDVMSLVEKVQDAYSEDEMEGMQERMFSKDFNFEDMLSQFRMVKRMGPLGDVLKMMPGVGQLLGQVSDEQIEEGNQQMRYKEALICSMTPEERRRPDILSATRRKRIASGAGRGVNEVNMLLKELKQMRQMMQQFKGLAKAMEKGRMPRMPGGKGFRLPPSR